MRWWKGALGLAMLAPLCVTIGMQTGGCSGDSHDQQASGRSRDAGKDGRPTGGAGGAFGFAEGGAIGAGVMNPDAACVATSVQATLRKLPVDVIFIIDNSGSMTDNIESVQNNINDSFASIIGASGVDYRVIMISEHGSLGT